VLGNDRCKVIHGMVTSGNWPLQSTLNGIDGVGEGDVPEAPLAYAPDGAGG